MNYWVLTRLFWDPTQDVDELYHYYIERTYREGSPQMHAYFKLTSRDGETREAPNQTKLQAVRDGDHFVLRFRLEEPNGSIRNALDPRPDEEIWPEGNGADFSPISTTTPIRVAASQRSESQPAVALRAMAG